MSTVLAPADLHLRNNSAPATSVALGVVTYNNEAQQLCRLLLSMECAAKELANSGVAATLFTTDCGAATKWAESVVSTVQLPFAGNLGFGGGMNRLMAAAFAKPDVHWFICVNPDGLLHPRLLREMLQWSTRYPDSLIEARQFPEEHPKNYDPVTGITLWASGACLLIPRHIYATIGGFDERMFMYVEDVDYSWRARLAGFQVRVAPQALFAHPVLDRKPSRSVDRYCYLSARYLAYKWRDRKHQAFFEQVIRDRGYLNDAALPPLPPSVLVDYPVQAILDPIATFDHGLAFAPLRWDPFSD